MPNTSDKFNFGKINRATTKYKKKRVEEDMTTNDDDGKNTENFPSQAAFIHLICLLFMPTTLFRLFFFFCYFPI